MTKLVALADDGLVLRNVRRLATTMGLDLVRGEAMENLALPDPPGAVLIDVEREGGIDSVAHCKQRWPRAMVIGIVTMPTGEIWKQAEAAGCDLVTTRGALTKAVPDKLARWLQAPGGRRLRLFSLADIAGRLGVVERIEDPVAGRLAVYHVGGEICVVGDSCPHAGARLSEGEVSVDDGVVTCPLHGSRFDVTSGERVRGPADEGIETFRVVVEEGQVYVQLEQT